jgi:hypothetical protein
MSAFVQCVEQIRKLARAEFAHEARPIHLYGARTQRQARHAVVQPLEALLDRIAGDDAFLTFAELDMPGVVSSTWWGIGTPAKTPEAVQTRLRAATAKILSDADYVARRLAAMALEPMVMTPKQASAFVDTEVRKTVAAAAKIQVDQVAGATTSRSLRRGMLC